MANSFKNTTFRSPAVFGNITVVILGCILVTAILNIVISLFMIASPDAAIELKNGDTIETAWLMIGLLALIELALRLICAVFFLIWLYRAFNNLPVLGARKLLFSPGWAVGWWFIPLANLVAPFKAVKELYAESDPSIRDGALRALSEPASFELIGFWWGTLIVSSFALRIADRLGGDGGADASNYFPVAYFTAHVLLAISAVLAAIIVRTVNSWQAAGFEKRSVTSRYAPPPPPAF